MTATVLKLVPEPVASEAAQDSVMQLLNAALHDAVAGNVSGVFLLVCHPNGTWVPYWTGETPSDTMLGRMAIATRRFEKLVDESNDG